MIGGGGGGWCFCNIKKIDGDISWHSFLNPPPVIHSCPTTEVIAVWSYALAAAAAQQALCFFLFF